MKDSSSKGLGLCDVLAVVFIVLKLIGVIDGAGGGYLRLSGFQLLS